MPTDLPTSLTFVAECAGGRITVTCALDEGTTRETAEAVAALFPRSCKLRGTTLSGRRNAAGERFESGYLTFHAALHANGVHGARNETGITRYKRLLAHAAQLGYSIEWGMPFRNSLTQADAEVLLSGTDAEAAAIMQRERDAYNAWISA